MKMLKKGNKSQGEGEGCVQRMEVIVKRKKKVSGRGGGQGRYERRSEAFVKILKKMFVFFEGGGGVRVGGWGGGVRVDVNGEVELL